MAIVSFRSPLNNQPNKVHHLRNSPVTQNDGTNLPREEVHFAKEPSSLAEKGKHLFVVGQLFVGGTIKSSNRGKGAPLTNRGGIKTWHILCKVTIEPGY